MTFRSAWITALVGGIVFLAGCRDEKSYELSLKMPVGYAVEVKQTAEARSESDESDGTIHTSRHEYENVYRLECVAVEPNGVMHIKKTWLEARFKQEWLSDDEGHTGMDFDSADPNKEQVGFYLEPVIGKSVLARIGPDGCTLGTEGATELAEKIVERQECRGPEDDRQKAVASRAEFISAVPGPLAFYPGHPVKVGDRWKMPFSKCGGDKCPLYAWKLEDVRGDTAELRVELLDTKDSFPPPSEEYSEGEVTTSVEITLSLDVKTGLVRSLETTTSRVTVLPRKRAESLEDESIPATRTMRQNSVARIETKRVD